MVLRILLFLCTVPSGQGPYASAAPQLRQAAVRVRTHRRPCNAERAHPPTRFAHLGTVFTPLMTIALWETFHGRSRSMASGIATTAASALLVPVITMATYATSFSNIDSRAWLSFAFLALYFSGTVPLVKTMVRERKTPGFTQFSILFHTVCAIAFAAIVVALLTKDFSTSLPPQVLALTAITSSGRQH